MSAKLSLFVSEFNTNMLENNRIKSNRPKKVRKIPSSWIAEVSKTSPSMVRMVRNEARNTEKGAGLRVELAEMLLEEGVNKLLDEVKRVVNF